MAQSLSVEDVKQRWPLHYYVWNKDIEGLEKHLKEQSAKGELQIDQLDPRKRSALALAVTLFHKGVAFKLLEHLPDVNLEDQNGFTVFHEALDTKDFQLIKEIWRHREFRRVKNLMNNFYSKYEQFNAGHPFEFKLHYKLKLFVKDVDALVVQDTMLIRRRGNQVTIGYTLVGIDKSSNTEAKAKFAKTALCIEFTKQAITMWVVNENLKEDRKVVYPNDDDQELLKVVGQCISDEEVNGKLSQAVKVTTIDSKDLQLEQIKALWKKENRDTEIESVKCARYTLKVKEARCVRVESSAVAGAKERRNTLRNPHNVSLLAYFGLKEPEKDIGLPNELVVDRKDIKAHLWEAVDPSSTEQLSPNELFPILELLAIHKKMFEKVYHYFMLKPTENIPVRIEFPISEVYNQVVTLSGIQKFPREGLFDAKQLETVQQTKSKMF